MTEWLLGFGSGFGCAAVFAVVWDWWAGIGDLRAEQTEGGTRVHSGAKSGSGGDSGLLSPIADSSEFWWITESTDPAACTCRHGDLPAAWHLFPCPNKRGPS